MSGRDFKSFITSHRSIGDEDAFTRKILLNGHDHKKYKQVDYEKINLVTKQTQDQADRGLQKLIEFKKKQFDRKNKNLIQKHRYIWLEHYRSLEDEKKRMQTEIDVAWRNLSDDNTFKIFMQDVEELQAHLQNCTQEFKEEDIESIYRFNNAVKQCIEKFSNLSENVQAKDLVKQLRKELIRLKLQILQISEGLYHEHKIMELELNTPAIRESLGLTENQEKDIYFETGIPEEVNYWKWPDTGLKATVLQEFINLDNQYRERLEDLKEKHSDMLRLQFGDWSEEDHQLFVLLREQYPNTMKDRRILFIDRIKRHMPERSILDIDNHERWCIERNCYNERRNELLHSWNRSHRELLVKFQAMVAEVWSNYEQAKSKELATQKQEQICQNLRRKVAIWREQKMELLRLEEELAAKQKADITAKAAAEVNKAQRKRQDIRNKINDYRKKLVEKHEEEEQKAKTRLEELRKILAEQAVKDKARIEFRKAEYAKKLEEKRLIKEKVAREEAEKEERLEKLRQKVEVHVEIDPSRVLKPTEAYNAKTTEYLNEELELQHPIFPIYGYSADKILADPRHKVETALRSAGLLKSDYARLVLATVPPPQQPRPDQETTMYLPSLNRF